MTEYGNGDCLTNGLQSSRKRSFPAFQSTVSEEETTSWNVNDISRSNSSSRKTTEDSFIEIPTEEKDATSKLKLLCKILRIATSRCTEEEIIWQEQLKGRCGFSYSPFVSRSYRLANSRCLADNNMKHSVVSGRQTLLYREIREALLDNRWLDVLKLSYEHLRYSYSSAVSGSGLLINSVIKPITLAICDSEFNRQSTVFLEDIFRWISRLPLAKEKRIRLEASRIDFMKGCYDFSLEILRAKFRDSSYNPKKDPLADGEIFAFETLIGILTKSQFSSMSGKIPQVLRCCNHWVVAPLSFHGNITESSTDLNQIWHTLCEDSEIPKKQVSPPSSCRLRYALSLADVIVKRSHRENETDKEGERNVDDQLALLLQLSPSDELLIYYSETRSEIREPCPNVSLLFKILDSPKLARSRNMWRRLYSTILSSRGNEFQQKLLHEEWVDNRDCWWPSYINELAIPKSSRNMAQKVLSFLQNM